MHDGSRRDGRKSRIQGSRYVLKGGYNPNRGLYHRKAAANVVLGKVDARKWTTMLSCWFMDVLDQLLGKNGSARQRSLAHWASKSVKILWIHSWLFGKKASERRDRLNVAPVGY